MRTFLRRLRGAVIVGVTWSALLGVIERRRSLEKLSIPRVAIWGALGSAAIPLLMGRDGSMWPVTAGMGAIFAAGTLAIARRNPTSSTVGA